MNRFERFEGIFLVAGIGFFLLSFLGMGLAPWTTLKKLKMIPEGTGRTAEEELGRTIFIHEGCWHCHTQFVRPVAGEPRRYGPVSQAMEHINEIPQLFGTRRVGPDLAREGGKRSNDWHLAHFYNPRLTVPWSVMPGFPWFYKKEGGKIIPTEKAKALTAYMQSLGKSAKAQMEKAEEEYRKNFRIGSILPPGDDLLERGKELFAEECSGCHGPQGDGNSEANKLLLPAPADLTEDNPTPEYVYTVLHKGIPGSAMPHFRDCPEEDIWALSYYVVSLEPKEKEPVIPPPSPEVIDRGKEIFSTTCAVCHGAEGRGDGPAGIALKPSPPDFHGMRPSFRHIVDTLLNGIPGTAMAPFVQLSTEDKEAIAFYIRSLYTAGEKQ